MNERPPFAVRRATQADWPELLRLLTHYRTPRNAEARFHWLYRDNPDGRAETWLAIDPPSGDIVGFSTVLPRTFQVAGQKVVGSVGCDAFVRPDHRRRGIAQALHVATRSDFESGAVAMRFEFGPPAPANLAALVKAGASMIGVVRTFVRPLTLGGLLEMSHYQGRAASGLRLGAAALDGVLGPLPAVRLGAQARPLEASDAAAVDALWGERAPALGVIGRRDAAWLDWRYRKNPVCQQELVALLGRRGDLVGWAALEFAPDKGCLLVDHLLPASPQRALRALGAAAAYAAERGAGRLAARVNLASPGRALFLAAGFLPGRVSEEFMVLGAKGELAEPLLDFSRWYFTSGDLNPEATHWSVVTAPDAPWSNADYREPPRVATGS